MSRKGGISLFVPYSNVSESCASDFVTSNGEPAMVDCRKRFTPLPYRLSLLGEKRKLQRVAQPHACGSNVPRYTQQIPFLHAANILFACGVSPCLIYIARFSTRRPPHCDKHISLLPLHVQMQLGYEVSRNYLHGPSQLGCIRPHNYLHYPLQSNRKANTP